MFLRVRVTGATKGKPQRHRNNIVLHTERLKAMIRTETLLGVRQPPFRWSTCMLVVILLDRYGFIWRFDAIKNRGH